MRNTRRMAAVGVVVALALGGCAGWRFLDDPSAVRVEGAAGARDSIPVNSNLAATEDDGPYAPVPPNAAPGEPTTDWTIAPVTTTASRAARLAATGVTASVHEGFDRLEIELNGEGTPGWDARYVLFAFDEGLGRRLTLDGQHILQIRIAGTDRPQELGLSEYVRAPIAGAGPALRQVMYRSNLAGITTLFIGVDGTSPPQFRVYLEQEPLRLVIELEDPSAQAPDEY